MTPISLSITNFGPFKETQTFTFPREPGLYFMWGENQHEPRLEANGAGKSKLWEALVWVIFGKTSRGLKAGDAANWEAGKGACIEFSYHEDSWDAPVKVTRTWSPNSWTWTDWAGNVTDLAKDSNPFMSELRLEFTPFLNSVLMAQGEPLFLDLKAEAKAQLFASVMDLDRWLEYSQKASKKAAEQDLVCRRIDNDLAKIKGQIEQAEGAPLESLSDQWVETQAGRIAQVERDCEILLNTREGVSLELSDSEKAEERARVALNGLTSEAAAVLEGLATINSLDQVRDEIADCKAELELHRKNHGAIVDHRECPTCGQAIDNELRGRRFDELHQAEAQSLATTVRLNKIKSAIQADLDRAQEAQERARKRVSRAQVGVDEASARTREDRRDLERLDKKLDDLETLHEQMQAEVNPYAALITLQDERRADLRREAKSLQRRLDDSDERYRLFTSWVKWFKEIRLSLIAEALEQLEIEVNNCINALGLVNWELHFDVDRENRSGSIQRGFNVFVQAPHNNRAVPWEAWSGGEGQRLRVAAQQGLANLIRQRTGTKFNLEVWDEPTQWMSAQGVTDLLDSLALRADAEQRHIWIVDHRTLGYSNFKGSCGVIKGRDGSSRFDLTGLYKSGHEQPTNAAGDPPHDVVRKRTRAKR